ncbi:DUF397 domain-containing protein [Kitasatospora purpeofusca]|uniref:DUF397 domain-containing protein n=1 Tax=Kitasatospora purpeofusca TaxID=67352 RepID=UPI0036BC1AE1
MIHEPPTPSPAAGLTWVKSSHSGGGGNCVEVAVSGRLYYIRDSKDPHGPTLAVTPQAYAELLRGVAAGEFDSPE